jgi:hypothetical protein
MYKYLLPMLAACAPIEPIPAPTPSPTPTPVPTEVPTPAILAPSYIPVSTPFAVSVCDGPFQTNRRVFVDDFPLGTLGWNSASGCSMLIIPGLSGAGIRSLAVDGAGLTLIKILSKR